MVIHIDIQPETEQLLKRELESGRFASVDEMIVQAVQAREHGHYARPIPSAAQRAASYRNWYQSLPRNEVVLSDDSREAIYGDHP